MTVNITINLISPVLELSNKLKEIVLVNRLNYIDEVKQKELAEPIKKAPIENVPPKPPVENAPIINPKLRKREVSASGQQVKLGHFWLLDTVITQGPEIVHLVFGYSDPRPLPQWGNPYYYWAWYAPFINRFSIPISYCSSFATGDAKQVTSVQLDVTRYPSPPDPYAAPELAINSSGISTITAKIMKVEEYYTFEGWYYQYYLVYEGFEECFPYGGYVYETSSVSKTWQVYIEQHKTTRIYDQFDRRHLVLPTGRGNFIVIVLLSCSWQMELRYAFSSYDTRYTFPGSFLPADSSYNTLTQAFICNDNSCRAIALPQTMQALINKINPEYTLQSQERAYVFVEEISIMPTYSCPPIGLPYSVVGEIYWINQGFLYGGWDPTPYHTYEVSRRVDPAAITTYSRPDIPSYEPTTYYGLKSQAAITPAIYETLNAVSQFVDPALIRSFPETRRWMVENEPISNTSRSYGLYSVPGDPVDHPDGTISVKPGLDFNISPPYHSNFPDPTSEDFNGTLYTIWDWNDPNYCVSMCLALGFNIEDLTP